MSATYVRPNKSRNGPRPITIRMSVDEAEAIIFALMGPDAPPIRGRVLLAAARTGSKYARDYCKSRGIKWQVGK